MNCILVFKNEGHLQRAGIRKTNLIQPYQLDDDTVVYLFNDNMALTDVESNLKAEHRTIESNFYVVLHESEQLDSKEAFKSVFGPNVITQSHSRGQFFFSILPRLTRNENVTFEEIKAFFPDQSLIARLKLLHKLLMRDFNLDINEHSLINLHQFPFEDFQKSTDEDWDRQSLINFRDKLI